MTNYNFIKSITSKDFNQSQEAIKNLINSKNLTLYSELSEKSEFIFPFIKERIIKNFVNLINKNNLDNIFEFTKIYSFDFESLIVLSWVKYADEDLTDEILELFEKGTQEQKAYCAKYFSYIKDSLALDLLEKNAHSDFEPLRTNCAITLSSFGSEKIIEDMKQIIETSDDAFKQLSALQFLTAYNNENLIDYIAQKAYNNPFAVEILTSLKNFYSLETLKKNLSIEDLSRIFGIFIENYPENISLDTIFQYEIFDFIDLLNSKETNNQYIENILFIAKNKFVEFLNNEIYNFDLDKNTKDELKNIVNLLSQFDFNFISLKEELDFYNSKQYRYDAALSVIKEAKLEKYGKILADLINENKLDFILLSKTALVLKELNKENLINKSVIEKLDNENVKALILSVL